MALRELGPEYAGRPHVPPGDPQLLAVLGHEGPSLAVRAVPLGHVHGLAPAVSLPVDVPEVHAAQAPLPLGVVVHPAAVGGDVELTDHDLRVEFLAHVPDVGVPVLGYVGYPEVDVPVVADACRAEPQLVLGGVGGPVKVQVACAQRDHRGLAPRTVGLPGNPYAGHAVAEMLLWGHPDVGREEEVQGLVAGRHEG